MECKLRVGEQIGIPITFARHSSNIQPAIEVMEGDLELVRVAGCAAERGDIDLLMVLKHTLNPLTRRLARSSFGPFSIVQHVGRHSGKQYETPIIVAPLNDGFVIELTYGPNVDWHKNVLAAGGCRIIWHGKQFAI